MNDQHENVIQFPLIVRNCKYSPHTIAMVTPGKYSTHTSWSPRSVPRRPRVVSRHVLVKMPAMLVERTAGYVTNAKFQLSASAKSE